MSSTSQRSRAASAATLVVGLGSAHGDDRLGWIVAESLAREMPPGTAKTAGNPWDLLDWVEGISRLVLCDVCQSRGALGRVHRWEWPTTEIAPRGGGGSHDADLLETLRLMERIGWLPERLVIWAVEGNRFEPGAAMSAEVAAAVSAVIAGIRRDLV